MLIQIIHRRDQCDHCLEQAEFTEISGDHRQNLTLVRICCQYFFINIQGISDLIFFQIKTCLIKLWQICARKLSRCLQCAQILLLVAIFPLGKQPPGKPVILIRIKRKPFPQGILCFLDIILCFIDSGKIDKKRARPAVLLYEVLQHCFGTFKTLLLSVYNRKHDRCSLFPGLQLSQMLRRLCNLVCHIIIYIKDDLRVQTIRIVPAFL